MKKILSLALFLLVVLCGQPSFAIRIGIQDYMSYATIGASTNAVLINAQTGKTIYTITPMKAYDIKPYKSSIAIEIDNKFFDLDTQKVVVKPQGNGFVSAKKRWYRGELTVLNQGGKLTIVNNLPIDEYIKGVVPSEMPSKWNIEAHKAQAIAARSYAIANRGKRGSRGYDLKDTPEDQAYGGASSETKQTNRAVLETQGVVITYNRQIISAYYSASAGGRTTNSGALWSRDLPYLKSVPSFDSNVGKNGHGIGMSQHGANNLAKQGYNAYQILAYYYNDIKFGRLRPEWNL